MDQFHMELLRLHAYLKMFKNLTLVEIRLNVIQILTRYMVHIALVADWYLTVR